MRAHAARLFALGVLAALIGACGGSGSGETAKPVAAAPTAAPAPVPARPQPGPPQSAALPADGGEVGKRYNELIAALQAGDFVRAAKVVYQEDPKNPSVSNKEIVDMTLPEMQKVHVAGGVWQADRATLFLDGEALHGYIGASLTDTGWLLDSDTARTAGDDFLTVYNCKNSKFFPCAAMTFPDAKVSGTIKPYPGGAAASGAPPSNVVLDGFGVRVLDAKTRALAYTEVFVSHDAFEPHFFGTEDLIIHENGSSPAFRLRIAPDGKSAKLAYLPHSPEIDATSALNLDTGTPNRVRGHLKLDLKDVAQFDVTFDVGTVSECLMGDNRCGNAH